MNGSTDRNRKLSIKEIEGYRQWLEELDAEAQQPEGDPRNCNDDIWEIFDPNGTVGKQVYDSFSDEELLDVLIRKMDRPGHKLRLEEVYCIHKQYIRRRFKGLHNAEGKARIRRKQLRDQARWPSDWPERVSAQPLIEKLQQRGKELLPEDYEMFAQLCHTARMTGQPPTLTVEEQKRLNTLYNWKLAFELMGIPALKKSALKHLQATDPQNKREVTNGTKE